MANPQPLGPEPTPPQPDPRLHGTSKTQQMQQGTNEGTVIERREIG